MSSDPTSAGALIRRWFDEVWNQGRTEAIDELLPDHATMWGVGRPEQSSRGAAEFKGFHQAMRAACPDTKIVLDHIVEQGDTAFARWTVTATHTGEGLGIPATNRKMKIQGMSACRVQDGSQGLPVFCNDALLRNYRTLHRLQGPLVRFDGSRLSI